ncbi:DUF6090 family protein [Flavobacteriaceae bacterium S356]|uniref:DUF6090 family protein n=1 Tax=Asprobacillus argus TaxID=3076534 RepID=A0ABU3LBH9_9FLAO|nr:DUF6090 family protein [Flavobacteriaceae bacterium S356]
MIKFFRRIRHKLLSENKFSKYLIYAIGEIILVVIGILIALSINNWNDYQKDREIEQLLLENLLKDLEKDKLGLARSTANNQYSLKVMDTMFYNISSNSNYNIMDFLRHNASFLYFNQFLISKGTYVENLSSGKFSLISTDTLKGEILDYYEIAVQTLGADKTIIPIMKDLSADFNELLGGTQEYAMVLGLKTNFPNIDIKGISNNPKYHRILTGKYLILRAQISDWKRFMSTNEHLIKSIQQELDVRFK